MAYPGSTWSAYDMRNTMVLSLPFYFDMSNFTEERHEDSGQPAHVSVSNFCIIGVSGDKSHPERDSKAVQKYCRKKQCERRLAEFDVASRALDCCEQDQ